MRFTSVPNAAVSMQTQACTTILGWSRVKWVYRHTACRWTCVTRDNICVSNRRVYRQL